MSNIKIFPVGHWLPWYGAHKWLLLLLCAIRDTGIITSLRPHKCPWRVAKKYHNTVLPNYWKGNMITWATLDVRYQCGQSWDIVCTKWIYAAFLYTCNCNSLPLAKFQAGSIHLSFSWLGESENIRMNEWGAVWESSSSSFSEENHSQSAKRSKWQLIQVGICRESLLHLHYELGAKKTCFTLLPVIFWWGLAENQFSSTPHPAPS